MSAFEGSAWQEQLEQQKQAPKAAPETKSEDVKADRGIGPEKLSVRIFREVFAASAEKAGHLRPDLDEYLRRVMQNKSATRSDKAYARKIYTDLGGRAGGEGLPDWAKKPEPTAGSMSDREVEDLLEGIEPVQPSPPPAPLQTETKPLVEDIDLDAIIDAESKETDPFLTENGPFKSLIHSFRARSGHPFIRSFHVDGQRYVAVGTISGVFQVGQNAGKRINIHCTVNPHRKLRDVPSDIVICRGGRQVSAHRDDDLGLRRHLFCLKHIPGLKIRFWMRIDEKDEVGGARFVILTNDEQGYKLVSRSEF